MVTVKLSMAQFVVSRGNDSKTHVLGCSTKGIWEILSMVKCQGSGERMGPVDAMKRNSVLSEVDGMLLTGQCCSLKSAGKGGVVLIRLLSLFVALSSCFLWFL